MNFDLCHIQRDLWQYLAIDLCKYRIHVYWHSGAFDVIWLHVTGMLGKHYKMINTACFLSYCITQVMIIVKYYHVHVRENFTG